MKLVCMNVKTNKQKNYMSKLLFSQIRGIYQN